ncbi:MAG: hypothetical protein KVP17_002921 [Porospora cf. gigantea B]|uniref:uncharacterized protein n=1 Tax=Porospora cf. gigantea B TaxID=2853592 RepID=UPI003571DDB4|nr:MAG: hypothetical protein KVP17_002921 [Porospora cf. gigantea B]
MLTKEKEEPSHGMLHVLSGGLLIPAPSSLPTTVSEGKDQMAIDLIPTPGLPTTVSEGKDQMAFPLDSAPSYTLPPVFSPRPHIPIQENPLLSDVDPSTYADLSAEAYQTTVCEIDIAGRVAALCEGLTPKEMAALQDEVSRRIEVVSHTVRDMPTSAILAEFCKKKRTQLAVLHRIQNEFDMKITGTDFLREKEEVFTKYGNVPVKPIHDNIEEVAEQLRKDAAKQVKLLEEIGQAIETDKDDIAYSLGQQLAALQASMARSETRLLALSDLKMEKNPRIVVDGPKKLR